jgi:hypothetical protein
MKKLHLAIGALITILLTGSGVILLRPDSSSRNIDKTYAPVERVEADSKLKLLSEPEKASNSDTTESQETLGSSTESTPRQNNETPTYTPPPIITTPPPEPEPPKTCNYALLDSWNSLYKSKNDYYDTLIVSENVSSTNRLDAALGNLRDRGLGFGGLADKARQDEKSLHASKLAEIEAGRNTDLSSLQNTYPINCP